MLCVGIAVVAVACEERDPCLDFTACDIRRADCQEAVVELVVCHRGGAGAEVKLSVVSERELVDRIRSEPLGEEELVEAERVNRALSLFELASEDFDREHMEAQILSEFAAVYLRETREILIVDRGVGMSTMEGVEVLAHEVVHAIQDAELDLDDYYDRYAGSYDESLAIEALTEGEATHYQALISAQLHGLAFDEVDWSGFWAELQDKQQLAADEDENPLSMAQIRFPYAFGGELVSNYYAARGAAGVTELFESPPRSTWEVLFGPSDYDLAADRHALASRSVPELPDNYELVLTGSLGAWIERIFAARRGVPIASRFEVAERTAADSFSIAVDRETGGVIASWRMRMVERSMPSIWPNTSLRRLDSAIDADERELMIAAGDPELPSPIETWSWRPAPASEPDERPAQGVLRPRKTHLPCGRALPIGGW